jgi:hypothetical protein
MSWTDKSLELLQSIAADDMVGACYLVNFHDVEAYEPRLRGGYAAAWTSPIMDLILADWLTKQERWTGRGFATILHSDLLPRWMDYAGAVLHEFGHYLTMPVTKDCDKDESIVNNSLELVGWLPLLWSEKNHRPITVQTVARKPLPLWHDHGPDFVRACCHLVRRAQHSVYIRPEHLRFVSPYHGRRVHEDDFMDALESELSSTGSIREILRSDAPDEFTELWTIATETF